MNWHRGSAWRLTIFLSSSFYFALVSLGWWVVSFDQILLETNIPSFVNCQLSYIFSIVCRCSLSFYPHYEKLKLG
jgi:hypothetical protein